MDYCSLHTHTTFSTGDGYGTVAQHVSRVKELGMTAVAFTEHGNCSSWVQLEKEAKKQGIKPIFGCEIYTAPPHERKKCHMILLAMNEEGLQNLNRIITQSYRDFYQFPTVLWPTLKEFNRGIIALSGCSDSHLSCVLLGGKSLGDKRMELSDRDIDAGVKLARKYQAIFDDRYYLECQRFPGLERTCLLNPALAEISKRTGISLAATSDVHYPYPTENAMQRILHAAHRGGSVESADATWEYSIILTYPTSDKEIILDLENTFGDHPQADMLAINAVLETKAIANRCNVELPKAPPVKYIEGEHDWDEW
jgi:Zierdtviridae DNA polymerase